MLVISIESLNYEFWQSLFSSVRSGFVSVNTPQVPQEAQWNDRFLWELLHL